MNEKQFYTVRDLQDLTGEAEPTWRKRLARREIPFSKFGSNVRIRREDFERWVDARRISGGEDLL